MENLHIEKLDTDIVVIGGGGGGLAAALTAAERGAKVLILEKRRSAGGNSALALGLFGAESPVQKRQRLDVRKDELFKIAMDYSHWTINPRIVRAFVYKSGDTIRWLEELGVRFEKLVPWYPNQTHLVYHCPRGKGKAIINALAKKCEELGIRSLYETSAKNILTNERGGVTGVVCIVKDREVRINTKGIIIATGGYGSNDELLKKYCPYYSEELRYDGIPLMGDGVHLTTEVGAATEGLGNLLIHGPMFPTRNRNVWNAAVEPYTIWLNKKGERFVDENLQLIPVDSANALNRQPDKICYSILDDKMKKNILEQGIERGVGTRIMPGTKLADLGKRLKVQANKGWVKISKSWDEIAQWIGASPEVLNSTIEEYNRFCERRCDEGFAKDPRFLIPLQNPPYYAIKLCQVFVDTIGGIKINHHMEVLLPNDNPIPGLYAVGVCAGGWVSESYCMILSGSAFGFAINSGRIGGKTAAEYSLR
jgi:fumarate reductase flavoprotein subunit